MLCKKPKHFNGKIRRMQKEKLEDDVGIKENKLVACYGMRKNRLKSVRDMLMNF